jgi:YgiT-type zinc finger domain-containing protein
MVIKLRCQDCGRIVDGKIGDKFRDIECSECEGNMEILDSEDDTYNPKNKKVEEEDITCDECGEDFDKEEVIEFEHVGDICKKCIDKAYPRQSKTQIEYKERIVEKPIIKYIKEDGTPLDTKFNPNKKTIFD